jgi:opacity protein-like surface antigen
MRRWIFALPLTLLLAPSLAVADDNCPPGSWFCEGVPDVEVTVGGDADEDEDEAEPAKDAPKKSKKNVKKQRIAADDDADDEADDDLATSPDDAPAKVDDAPPKKAKKKHKKKKRRPAQPQSDQQPQSDTTVEVDGEGDTVVIVKQKKTRRARVEEREDREDREERRPRRERRWRETVGLNLRVQGAAFLPRDTNVDGGGMGGVGASFRWRPSPYFAFDVGTDVIGGTDYNGNGRIELSGALSGLVYFNPQHRVQVYGIGGVHVSHAAVDNSGSYYTGTTWSDSSATYDYAGAHAGLGVEFRLSRHFALFADALGIVRQELNDDNQPEFRDWSTGETTDTSGAGLFRTGVTFWW